MKDGAKLGHEVVGTFSCYLGGGLQRSECTSSVDPSELRSHAITRTVPPSDAVTPPDDQIGPRDDLESTRALLELTRGGDAGARDRLVERHLPRLLAWAHGRLPLKLRHLADTDDLVQMTFVRALDHLDHIEFLHEGGFYTYLRTALRNQIVDLLRRDAVRPEGDSIPEDIEVSGPSPFDQVVGLETLANYEAGLEILSERQRAAVMLRIELGLTFKEVADAVGCPSANAARMLVARAVVRLSEVMNDPRQE